MGENDATGAHPLRSLRLVFWGLIAVVIDVRIDGPDVVPDPVAWLVALVGVARLARLHPGFGVAAVGCGLGLLVSLPDWAQPGDGSTGLLTGVAETGVVFGTCTGLIALLPARRATAARVRGWDLGLMLAVAALSGLAGLAGLDGTGAGGPLTALVVVLAVATVVVLVCFLVLLFRVSGSEPEIGPSPA
jgi:hypothetical protein